MGTAMDEIPACLYLQPFACNFKVFYCITNGCRFASYASTLPNWPQFYVISRFSVIMVSLGTDSHYQSRLAGRPPERSADGDTAHLIMETDEVAFWDMASGTNGLSSILVTGEDDSEKFHSIKNIPLVVFIIVLLVMNAVFSFVIPEICRETCSPNTSAFDLIAYLQVGMFFSVFLADLVLRRIHFKSRSCGYLEFYRRTRVFRRFPLNAVSISLASFLFVVIITGQFCQSGCTKNFTRANAGQLLCCLEAVVIIPVCARYIQISYQFNKAQATPDVLQEDLSTERILQTSVNHGNQVGFKDGTFKEDLLEKQADEILYLKKRNAYLSSRVLHLTRQLNASGELSVV